MAKFFAHEGFKVFLCFRMYKLDKFKGFIVHSFGLGAWPRITH